MSPIYTIYKCVCVCVCVFLDWVCAVTWTSCSRYWDNCSSHQYPIKTHCPQDIVPKTQCPQFTPFTNVCVCVWCVFLDWVCAVTWTSCSRYWDSCSSHSILSRPNVPNLHHLHMCVCVCVCFLFGSGLLPGRVVVGIEIAAHHIISYQDSWPALRPDSQVSVATVQQPQGRLGIHVWPVFEKHVQLRERHTKDQRKISPWPYCIKLLLEKNSGCFNQSFFLMVKWMVKLCLTEFFLR